MFLEEGGCNFLPVLCSFKPVLSGPLSWQLPLESVKAQNYFIENCACYKALINRLKVNLKGALSVIRTVVWDSTISQFPRWECWLLFLNHRKISVELSKVTSPNYRPAIKVGGLALWNGRLTLDLGWLPFCLGKLTTLQVFPLTTIWCMGSKYGTMILPCMVNLNTCLIYDKYIWSIAATLHGKSVWWLFDQVGAW